VKYLRDKTAFITGGSSGIGLGIAKVLAEEGMRVVITYRGRPHLEEALSYFQSRPSLHIHAIQLDVTDRSAFARAADEAEGRFGKVQVLVNNAGIAAGGLLENATYREWDEVLGTNLGGVVNGIVTFLPRMVASGLDGHIVNVSSVGGLVALGPTGIYTTSKFAVTGLTEALRADMTGRNIGVSVFCPGSVRSNIGAPRREQSPDAPPLVGKAAEHAKSMAAFVEHGMDPITAGRHVLRGILANQLFVLSHPEFRDSITARADAIDRALSGLPKDEARAATIGWLEEGNPYRADG
jgi:NAD(P)-dependent dehydrogenase (short-subunit alcohol dehydrogenase family)